MIKKILTIICAITLIFSIEVSAESLYNNEEKATCITKIAEKELYTHPGQCFYGSWEPNYSREYIMQRIGAEPYWRKGKENIDYGIYKTDTTHYLIITSYGSSYSDRWYVSKIPSKELFEKYVKVGTTMEVVKLIDPDITDVINGIFPDYATSYHRFEDGTFSHVHYMKNSDGEFVVERIDYDKDVISVVDNLLDIDYQLIKNDNTNEEAEFLEKLKRLNEKPKSDEDVTKPVTRKPKKVKIKSIKRIKKKSIRIKFQKAKNAKKYEVQYAFNRKFKNAKIKTIKKNYCTIKASKKKTYYIRVRGVNATKKGVWSKIKRVKKVNK